MRCSLRRNRAGAVLVEFAVSALLFVTVLLSTIEWSLELYVRHSTERALAAALRVYSTTGDEVLASEFAMDESSHILGRCIQPLEFRLFDSVAGVNIADSAAGYAPTGTAADDAAVFARITLSCHWERFTPLISSMLGPEMRHTVTGMTGMR